MIHLNGAVKRYRGRAVLDGFTIDVLPGEVVALVGPNGAGKSTALKAAIGIVRLDAGAAHINGFDVTRQPELARTLVGYMPQRLAFPEHVTASDLARLVAALRSAGSAEAMASLDRVGLGDRRTTRVRELSGGQRQRLSLALALLGQPRALILDEPSISLDAEGADVVRGAILGARARRTATLFASHHLDEIAELADRVIVLREGRRVSEATAAMLHGGGLPAFYRRALLKDTLHVG